MPAMLEWTHIVAEQDLDGLGHANNISYLKWMQSAALAHSAAQGWSAELYAERGFGWVVRTHFIEYLSPALLGDQVVVRTWVADMGKVTSRRKFLMIRRPAVAEEKGKTSGDTEVVLARAETNWAFIDYRTGAPKRIPPEVSSAFEMVEDIAESNSKN